MMECLALKVEQLEGVFTAIITPVNKEGAIDYEKLDLLIEDQIRAGVAGIVPCGTTGQSPTLSHDEHVKLAVHVAKRIDGRVKTVISAGSNSTREAIELSNRIEDALGPVTLLHVTGYYNCPPQEGLLQHYLSLAGALLHQQSNIVLYNVPSRTACGLEIDTILSLAAHSQIIGIKEVGSVETVAAVVEGVAPQHFRVLSGEDPLLAAMMEKGAVGTISAASNVAPSLYVKLVNAGLRAQRERGSFAECFTLQEKLMPLIEAVYHVKNPIPLAHMFGTSLRLPLCRVESVHDHLMHILSQYKSEELGIDCAKYREAGH